jgi:hypothetical protein
LPGWERTWDPHKKVETWKKGDFDADRTESSDSGAPAKSNEIDGFVMIIPDVFETKQGSEGCIGLKEKVKEQTSFVQIWILNFFVVLNR